MGRNIQQRLYNDPPPQTVLSGAVSASLKFAEIFIQATADCFYCISPTGAGTDGNPVGPTNGHFMPAGGSAAFSGLNSAHKLGVSGGTMYISAWG